MSRLHLSYIWYGDTSNWDRQLALINRGDVVVLNPSSGPLPDDAMEMAGVNELKDRIRSRGASVLGYLHLSYGDRSYADVFEDMRMWQDGYGVFRYFFDETPANMTKFAERRLVGGINPSSFSGIKAVFNSGTEMPVGFKPDIGNLVCTWEGPSTFFPKRQWKPWEVAIAYNVPHPLGRRSDGPLWQAWTSDVWPNPYDTADS